jgi:zinc transport system ATP-binding protein
MNPTIEIRDGAVELGGRPVLRGIDLSIGPGEMVVVLGANGSGKSTLVRAVLGLAPLCRGEVRLFGTPLERFRDWRRVGFVPQRVTAASGVPATVREVVASGRLAGRRLLTPMRAKDRAAVTEAIAAVGLTGRAGDRVSTLSGGQQQRALIARALAGRPDLLVLDEPTAGVDQASQEAFASTLAGLAEQGVTIVLVAHEIGPVRPLIGRTVVMRDGRIAYDGPPTGDAVLDDGHGHHRTLDTAHESGHADHIPTVASPVDPREEA